MRTIFLLPLVTLLLAGCVGGEPEPLPPGGTQADAPGTAPADATAQTPTQPATPAPTAGAPTPNHAACRSVSRTTRTSSRRRQPDRH